MLRLLLLALCVLGARAAEEPTATAAADATEVAATVTAEEPAKQEEEEPLKVLTDNNYRSELAAYNLSLVSFVLPGHPRCKQTLPELRRAARLLKKDLSLAAFTVDCTQERFLCTTLYQVDHFPTTKIFSGRRNNGRPNGDNAQQTAEQPQRQPNPTGKLGYVMLDDYEGRFSAEAFAYSLFARRDGKFVMDQVKVKPSTRRAVEEKQKKAKGLPAPPEGFQALYRDLFFAFKSLGRSGQVLLLASVWVNVIFVLLGWFCFPRALHCYLDALMCICCCRMVRRLTPEPQEPGLDKYPWEGDKAHGDEDEDEEKEGEEESEEDEELIAQRGGEAELIPKRRPRSRSRGPDTKTSGSEVQTVRRRATKASTKDET